MERQPCWSCKGLGEAETMDQQGLFMLILGL